MTRQAEEREPQSGPGPVVKTALRGIDACLNALQNLRNRLAGAEDRESRDSGRRRADPKRDEADGEALPRRPSLLRRLSIALLLLLVGLGAGSWLAYSGLSLQLKEHAGVVERMQEELDAVRKEDARNVKLLDKFQRENSEYRHEAREAQREAESAKGEVAELEAQIETMKFENAKRNAEAAQETRRVAELAKQRSRQRTPQKTANCNVGTAAEISECIEKFNR